MASIFDRNIEALRQKDPELADKLVNHNLTDVPQLQKENGYYNFLYKNIYLHNEQNPLQEAKDIFMGCENSPVAIHLIFGLGLGYLFQISSANSKGTVILFEQDLNILKTAFSIVDFSRDIIKSNVFISETMSKTENYIYQHSNTKNSPLLISTSGYRTLYKEDFDNMVEELQREVGRFGLDRKFTQENFYPLLQQLLNNVPSIIKEIPLVEIKDFYKGKTAVVVSAGPTLDRNIDTIKKYRDNIILIVVGTAMKTIASNGITPDFLCVIESKDSSRQIADLDLREVNFVTEPFSNPNLRKFEYKNIYSHISDNMPINNLWSELVGIDNSEYKSKGTVSYTALNVARILGCSKIVLVGQDLAYIEGQCYSKDSAYKDLECRYNNDKKKWEIGAKDFEQYMKSLGNYENPEDQKRVAEDRLDKLNKSLYYVKGINGDMIPTESVYAAFIRPISEFTETYPGIDYINTSMVGAQIDGYRNITLEEALLDSSKIENRDFKTNFKYNINLLKENCFKAKNTLNSTIYILEEIKKLHKNINNEIKRYRIVNADILKLLRKMVAGYSALSEEHAKKDKFFDFITAAERIDIDYEMKMVQEFTIDVINNIVNKINDFAEQTEERIKAINSMLDKIIEEQ